MHAFIRFGPKTGYQISTVSRYPYFDIPIVEMQNIIQVYLIITPLIIQIFQYKTVMSWLPNDYFPIF